MARKVSGLRFQNLVDFLLEGEREREQKRRQYERIKKASIKRMQTCE